MKTSPLRCIAFFALILISLSAHSQDFEKLAGAKVDKTRIEIAEKFSNNFYSTLAKGDHYEFRDEATDALKNAFAPEDQKTIYEKVKSEHGDYRSIAYAETWVLKSNPAIKIIRFYGTFSKQKEPVEIRVVLDKADKIAGFFIKPWSNVLNP
jgi:hypothetical protein